MAECTKHVFHACAYIPPLATASVGVLHQALTILLSGHNKAWGGSVSRCASFTILQLPHLIGFASTGDNYVHMEP